MNNRCRSVLASVAVSTGSAQVVRHRETVQTQQNAGDPKPDRPRITSTPPAHYKSSFPIENVALSANAPGSSASKFGSGVAGISGISGNESDSTSTSE